MLKDYPNWSAVLIRAIVLFLTLAVRCTGIAQENRSAPENRRVQEDAARGESIVVMAGGRVELTIPTGWSAFETPYRRQLRVVIAPETRVANCEDLDTAAWLTAYAEKSNLPLEREITRMLNGAYRTVEIAGEISQITIDGQTAVMLPFRLTGGRTGFHVLCETDWGTMELSYFHPLARHDEAAAFWMRWIRELRLLDALPPKPQGQPMGQPQPIVGTWKAYRSLLEIRLDGAISIATDSVRTLHQADGLNSDTSRGDTSRGDTSRGDTSRGTAIVGRYAAQDDLLLVTWNDGSKLNIRWKMAGPYLLLTDHQGRTSRLHRVLK